MKTFDKLSNAQFERLPQHGLMWIESIAQDRYSAASDDIGPPYAFWLLVEAGTDRIVAGIDGPEPGQITYLAEVDGCSRRKFISIDGAKRYTLATAIQILEQERAAASADRHDRKLRRIAKGTK